MKNNAQFIPGIMAPDEQVEPAWWFIFRGGELLVHRGSSSVEIPCLVDMSGLALIAVRQQYLGRLNSRHCYAAELAEGASAPAGMAFQGLRKIYGLVDEALFGLSGRAFQIVDWDRTHQFCTRCGAPVTQSETERAKECPRCALIQYPRIAPSIIVLIQRGPELLLARPYHFPAGFYSVIAGFVEPGETLEQAVEREVGEEVGIAIRLPFLLIRQAIFPLRQTVAVKPSSSIFIHVIPAGLFNPSAYSPSLQAVFLRFIPYMNLQDG